MPELTFKPLADFSPGLLYRLLAEAYAQALTTLDSKNTKRYQANWRQTDQDAFNHPETIGQCVFITCLDGQPIGFGSYDPRGCPEFGVVGHHCILPKYQGQGLGKAQLQHILALLKDRGCQKVKVTTTDNPFYLPAQKLYEKLGFSKVATRFDPDWSNNLFDYEKDLTKKPEPSISR